MGSLLSQSYYNNLALFSYNISHDKFDIKIDWHKQSLNKYDNYI